MMRFGTGRAWLARRPEAARLFGLTWPFAVVAAMLALLVGVSLEVMSSVRAYVAGESLWSKAQKDAVAHLMRYARTGESAEYGAYVEAMRTIDGDRAAREELQKADPDLGRAREGFLKGGNDPDDVPGMILLFRYFQHVDFMARAIDIWRAGDEKIAELVAVGEQVQSAIASRDFDVRQQEQARSRIRAIDLRLTDLERAFSATLGDASRTARSALTAFNAAVALTLIVVALLRARVVMTQRGSFEAALHASEERFERAVSDSNDGIWDWNVAADEIYMSMRFQELLGYAPGALSVTPTSFMSLFHPEDRQRIMRLVGEPSLGSGPFELELRMLTRTGEARWFQARGRTVRDAAGQLVRMGGSVTDIEYRKQTEAQLFAEKERAEVTLASIADAVITVDPRGCVEYLNAAAERLTEWPLAEAKGQPLASVFAVVEESTGTTVGDRLDRALREGGTMHLEGDVVLLRRASPPIAVDASVAPIRDRLGHAQGAVLVFQDMSRERQYAARLSHLATHDALTGLPNRREFENRLRATLERPQDSNFHHAVLYLDIDQFKIVNDTCGHAAGDEMLRQVSSLLRPELRAGDTIARLGGDEFGVLLEHCPPEPALRIAESLRRSVADFKFSWGTRSFATSVSIGMVNMIDGPRTLADALSAADAACYLAKDKGRNRIQVYHPRDTDVAVRHGEMEWVDRLQRALAEDRFQLFAQPIRALSGDETTPRHVELLVRLRSERDELVPPMAFVPAAERYNLMPLIDRWVVRNAFNLIAPHLDRSTKQAPDLCAINLSGASINDESFLDFVLAEFLRSGLPYSLICFEITETTAVTSLSKAAAFITALRGLGCRFALDDFGAGVSSFSYLKHLPVDYVKIDGSFVRDMAQDPVDRAMVEAIHSIGRVMGKQTIAESVETEEILELLRALGVDYAQGFGIARPAPFERMLEGDIVVNKVSAHSRGTN
ncbi:MAG TPA: EAL domain-containing protein [Casimicrobiaceae bacterium]|nr:EAL domain-containing protein [Casimicrobiaceae bacterium]